MYKKADICYRKKVQGSEKHIDIQFADERLY